MKIIFRRDGSLIDVPDEYELLQGESWAYVAVEYHTRSGYESVFKTITYTRRDIVPDGSQRWPGTMMELVTLTQSANYRRAKAELATLLESEAPAEITERQKLLNEGYTAEQADNIIRIKNAFNTTNIEDAKWMAQKLAERNATTTTTR